MNQRYPGLDGRLVPTALASWAAAWWLTGHTHQAGIFGQVGAVVVMVATLVLSGRGPRGGQPRQRASVAGQVALGAAAVALIAIVVLVHNQQNSTLGALAGANRTGYLIGRVATEPRPAPFGTGTQWSLKVRHGTVDQVTSQLRGTVRLTTPDNPPYGALVAVKVKLKPPRPGETFAARGVGTDVAIQKPPAPPIRWTNESRRDLLDATSGLSPQNAALVQGMAIGDTSQLPKDLAADFKTAGLTHLTAVSGGHFSIVLTLASAVTARLRAGKLVRVSLVGALAATFVLLVRPEPSVVRAAAMCAVAMLAIVLGRKQSTIPSLAACIVLSLIVDPALARSYGFALSCAATAGLATLTAPLTARLAPWLGRPLAFAIAVPLAAQLCCTPILALFTAALPTTSVLANVLAAPAVAPATMLGLSAAFLAPVSLPAAHGLARLAALATGWIAWVARRCAGLPGASLTLPWVREAGLAAALSAAGLSALLLAAMLCRPPGPGWPRRFTEYPVRVTYRVRMRLTATKRRYAAGQPSRRDRRVLGICAAIGLALLLAISIKTTLVWRQSRGSAPVDWQVAACDVGQGDALAVRTGQHAAMVIDVGPDRSAIDRCLTDLQVTDIDLLVLTHAHSDHIDGLPGAVAGRNVAAVLAPFDPHLSAPASNSTAGTIGRGEWSVHWQLLNPTPRFGDDLNNNSYALAISSSGPGGEIQIVDLADLEEKGQQQLLADLRDSKLATENIDLLKVAHHGSASQSSPLAEWLDPSVAVVSSGAGNSYGHPADAMLELYAGIGADIVRTDQCGTAVFVERRAELATVCTR